MANIRMIKLNSSLKFLLVLIIVCLASSNTIKSDQIDCKDIQCPPDIKCPSDSISSHVLYEPSQIPPDYDQEETVTNSIYNTVAKANNSNNNNDGNNYENDASKNRHNQKQHISSSKSIIEYNHDDSLNDINVEKANNSNFVDKYNRNSDNNDNDNLHELNKRNVQYKQRESIKIVPGDYHVSLIPEGFNPNFNNEQQQNLKHNQKRRKRHLNYNDNDNDNDYDSIEKPPSSSIEISSLRNNLTIIRECCLIQKCTCKNECKFSKCEKLNKITIKLENGDGKTPGKCCPKYKCIDKEPDCMNQTKFANQEFWIKDCMKCECISGHRLCHKSCNDENIESRKECFSSKRQRPYKEGDVWKEDNCTECECIDGERNCQISSCKPKNCPKQIKIPDECCPVCVDENDNSTSSTVKVIKLLPTLATKSTTLSTTITSATANDDTSSQVQEINQQSTQKSTAEVSSASENFESTGSSIETTTTSTTPDSTSTSVSSKSAATATAIKKSTTAKEPAPTTVPEGSMGACNQSTTVTVPITLTEHKEKIFQLLGTTKESMILYAVIVGLLLLCSIFVSLYIYEVSKRKKTSYRSIPSSDSNLSQIPRPIKTPTPPIS